MQESRLFKIIYHLLEKKRATAAELAEKFEVSVRTIYRDIDALSAAGIPVYAETGRSGGIFLMSSFVLNKAVLSETERQDIVTALSSLRATQSIDNNNTLNKLSALFNVSPDSWLEVDFSRWGSKPNDNKKFEQIKTAVLHRKAMKISYAGASETISERIIHPIRLMYKARAWYLKAFCTEKQDYRTFKLTRILNFELLDETFPQYILPEEKTPPSEAGNRAADTDGQIILCFAEEAAYRVYDEFDRDEVARQENGTLLVCTDMPQDAWLTGFLLSFGTQVEVIKPRQLREQLAAAAKEIYQKYKT